MKKSKRQLKKETNHKVTAALLLTTATVLFTASLPIPVIFDIPLEKVEAQEQLPVELPESGIVSPEFATTDSVKEMIMEYVIETIPLEYHQWFFDVIDCESKYNPDARSATNCKGILQFQDNTFYGNGGVEIWDWKDQIDTAWRMIERNPYAIEQWHCSAIMGY